MGRLRVAVPWLAFALVLAIAPWVFDSNLSLSLLTQVGAMVVICLSYNLLLGQGGMLSFGHAVYTGLGAFCAIHAIRLAASGVLPIPLSLVPLVGGLGGVVVAAILGYPSTRKAGTPFAMITLGVGELVHASALMFPAFFGGEGGVSANRVYGSPVWGIDFASQRQVYGLIAVYCFACTAALYAFTRTPLGRMLNAVRDNPQRAEFIGYNARQVRYLAFIIAGFFAGVGGGLTAIHFEIVTAESVGSLRSGSYLLFVFLGGSTVFFGPVIGAVLLVVSLVWLSELTVAWQLYLGLVFMGMVMAAPGGIAGVLVEHAQLARRGGLAPLARAYLARGAAAGVALMGVGAAIEMAYRWRLDLIGEASVAYLGLSLDPRNPWHWCGAAFVALTGGLLWALARRRAGATGLTGEASEDAAEAAPRNTAGPAS